MLAVQAWSAQSALAAEKRPTLLPEPQKLSYGAGELSLAKLHIMLPENATTEDSFAAQLLADVLSARAGQTVDIQQSSLSGTILRLTRTRADSPLPGANDRPGPESRESYHIKVTSSGGEIDATSSAGLFYAAQTIRQLIQGQGPKAILPALEIADWPALAYRGFMMDTAHGPLPTEEEIQRQMDFLARWKVNQYYLYSETQIELKGYPLLSVGDRYSQNQIRHIIAYGRERHIDVVPCMEFYAHLHDLFQLEKYADLSPVPHGTEINPRNSRVQAILSDWVAQIVALFPSPWFHVGLDEAWELEKAGSAASGGVPPDQLYIGHLKQITELVTQHGKRPMYWADVHTGARIFEKYPQLFNELPPTAIAVPWEYRVLPNFNDYVAPFAKRRVPYVVAPGIDCFEEIFPEYQITFADIDGFVADGRKNGTLGVINTGWTDSAQVIYRMARAGMAYGGVAGWQSSPANRSAFLSDYSSVMYPPSVASEVALALDLLSQAQGLYIQAVGSETSFRFWDDPLDPMRLKRYQDHRDQIRQARLLAGQGEEHILTALERDGDSSNLSSLLLGAQMLDYFGMKVIYSLEIEDFFQKLGSRPNRSDVEFYLGREISDRNHSRLADLLDRISAMRELYEQAWRSEYTTYRLGTALGRWDAELEYWRRLQMKLMDVGHRFHDGDSLPSLESLRPKT